MREQYNLEHPALTNLRNPSLRRESLVALGTFGALTAGAAVLGGGASNRGQPWYRRLRKPPFQPPSWVFAPVWTALYGLMTFSAWRVWNRPAGPKRSWALSLWVLQLGFNALWSPLFFGKHRKRAALTDIAALGVSLAAYTATARRVDPLAAWMMVPYLGWVGFASALNEEIVRLNP
ncbi:TspO/MBR family protein [Vitiosangium sp. GDMCC 1.1324]|uniref:TspO/MBR family protein n=1 Tax=Vitiosangium sp. (strain GDMCC 1.1324) TaxID=2138576 RepID=UPI000D339C6F|nr:TspO/MBR family protein [Vitiosangium sp. GDMCC 1.1324]PTL79934.1 tryptophan-rich sensory protein [Vitiosangium sp. GDMCC 1.1324]